MPIDPNEVPAADDVIRALYEPLTQFVRDGWQDEPWDHSPNFPNKWQKARDAIALADRYMSPGYNAGPGLGDAIIHGVNAIGRVLDAAGGAAVDVAKGAAGAVGDAAQGVADAAHKVSE